MRHVARSWVEVGYTFSTDKAVHMHVCKLVIFDKHADVISLVSR
jgi:hypothetical protein